MDLADRLQELRKKAGYSQEQVADMLGLSRQAISKWESRQGKPEIDNIIKLTEIYHVSADYILLGIDHSARQRLRRAPHNEPPPDRSLPGGVLFCCVWIFETFDSFMTDFALPPALGRRTGLTAKRRRAAARTQKEKRRISRFNAFSLVRSRELESRAL